MAFQEILLHVGLPKTGTTSIQRAFGEASAELRQHGIVYPLFPSSQPGAMLANHTFPLRFLVGFKKEGQFGDPSKFVNPAECRVVWDELSLVEGKKLIFSGEGLANMPGHNVQRLSELLAPLLTADGQMKILFTIREPSAWLASITNQLRKDYLQAAPFGLEQVAAGYGRAKGREFKPNEWAASFPQASIEIVRFEEWIARGGMASAMTKWAELPVKLSDFRENGSLSHEAKTLLNRLHNRRVRMEVSNFLDLPGSKDRLVQGEHEADLQAQIEEFERVCEFAGVPTYSREDCVFLDLHSPTLWSADTLAALKKAIAQETRLNQIRAWSEILNLCRDTTTGYHQDAKERMRKFGLRELVKLKPSLVLKFVTGSII